MDSHREISKKRIHALVETYNESIRLYGAEDHIKGVDFLDGSSRDDELLVSLTVQRGVICNALDNYKEDYPEEFDELFSRLHVSIKNGRDNYMGNLVGVLWCARNALKGKHS